MPAAADLFSGRSLNEPLGRRVYLTAGLTLMAVKYAVDASVIYMVTGITWTPIDYLVPLMSFVGAKVAQFPSWLNLLLLAWTAPFVWLGVTLSVRRAHSAGVSPWWVVAFFLPLLNYAFMIALSLLPEKFGGTPVLTPPVEPRSAPRVAMLAGAGAGAALGLGVASFGVMVLRNYGLSVFLGTPFMIGAVAGFVSRCLNAEQPLRSSVSAGVTAAVLLGAGLIAVAVEGLVCLVMAAPIALPIVALGAVIGHRLAGPAAPRTAGLGLTLLLLPIGSAIDSSIAAAPERVVLSTLEIEAPPERVWRHVVAFDEIREEPGWYFKLGLAYPVRARIVGEGPGAVRFCEFTTGAFREPITAWEAPTRLAFDVADQPPPLNELSPYARVLAPHQQNYFRTTRGEFRLVPLPGGRTRLEGRTWYSLRIYPTAYWTVLADRIIHDIHQRVLRHIEARATNH
jgi:uncharacterized membrane protein YhaH (DUF805 family)